MCYIHNSIEQATAVCPMCQVFPNARCNHQREVCRNRTNHPRFDVLYLKNAEVELFNGCGYCKWARQNTSKSPFLNNPGLAGCCRPPTTAAEGRAIKIIEWRAVSKIHHTPIPDNVRAVLDNFAPKSNTTARLKSPPAGERKQNGSPPSKGSPTLPKSPAVAIPGKPRTNSPKNGTASLTGSLSRNSGANMLAEFRRSTVEGSSPVRKSADLEMATTPRRGSLSSRQSIPSSKPHTPTTPTRNSPTTRASPATQTTPTISAPKVAEELVRSAASPFAVPVREDDEVSNASGSSGSQSDSTVTSDGGFTDYLSDESEEELQRQAEKRAALAAQNQAEEMEFRAARLRLTDVDLSPPKSWNATNPGGYAASRLTSASAVHIPTATTMGSHRS